MISLYQVNDFLDELRGGRMAEDPVVQVAEGPLRGRIATSPTGKAFYSFQGIPYARPPLGSLRFTAPQPSEPWEGIRDATAEGNVSAQIDPNNKKYVGDENCLFLNVYTPNLDGEFLPVMFFIHGGGFKYGSGSSSLYGADYLVEKDVVVVTINYRCGPLGFLSLNTPEVPGNAGLKDIVLALQWVKENIGTFGGNSGNITVFGESCGGVAVSMLTASPLTKNLISKAVIQSGTALNSFAFQKNPLDNARQLAKHLGCESEEADDILEFLRATSVKDIIEASDKLHPMEYFFEKHTNMFAPVVEKEFSGQEAVLTEAFLDILTSGRTADVPIMIGSNGLEFTYERQTDDLQIFIPEEFKIEKNTVSSLAIAERIKQAYFKGNASGIESLNEYFELLSDKIINVDTYRYVKYLVQVTNKPVYYYKFDYVGELNITKKMIDSLGLNHAGHMDELGYLFRNDDQRNVVATADDLIMRERMLRLWTNFAKCGNPTPEENHYLTVNWLPVTKDNLYYLHISNELALKTNPNEEKMTLWDDLYNKYFKIWEVPKENNDKVPETNKVNEDLEIQYVLKEKEMIESTEIKENDVVVEEKNEIVEESNVDVNNMVDKSNTEEAEHIEVAENSSEVVDNSAKIVDSIEIVDKGPETVVQEAEFITNKVIESVIEVMANPNSETVENLKKAIEEREIEKQEDNVQVLESVIEVMANPNTETVENLKKAIEEREIEKHEDKVPEIKQVKQNGVSQNGDGVQKSYDSSSKTNLRVSNEIKMASQSNGAPKDVIRANDPPEDDLPKNIGVNKFVNFFESLGGKK